MNKYTSLKKIVYLVIGIFFLILSLPPIGLLIIQQTEILLHRSLRDPDRWLEIIKHCSYIVMCFIGIMYILNYLKQGKILKQEIVSETKKFFMKLNYKRIFIIFLSITIFYCFCFFKVIDADFYYADDIWRSDSGSRSWIGFSRYISEFLSIIFHTNVYLPDIAPLTSFISILLMAVTTVLLSAILAEGNISIMGLISLSLIFISPFFAENFSYRFDSPYMVLAILFPIIPFMYMANHKVFLFTSIISLILCCMSYQAGSSIYILLTIYVATRWWLQKKSYKETGIFIGLAAASFIFALLLFKILFMNTMSNSSDDYFSTAIQPGAFLSNSILYIKNTFYLFGGLWTKGGLILITVIALLVNTRKSQQNKALSFCVLCIIFTVSYVLSFGAYLVFAKTLIAPRAFMGFNVLIALISYSLFDIQQNKNNKRFVYFLRILPVIALVYGCIVFLYAYGNCLSEQKVYQTFRTELLLADIQKFADNTQEINISIKGHIGLSNGFAVTAKEYPLITKMIPIVPSEGSIWNEPLFNTYNFVFSDTDLPTNPEYPELINTYYHCIHGMNNHFFIQLK